MTAMSLHAVPVLAANNIVSPYPELSAQLQLITEQGLRSQLRSELRDRGIAVENYADLSNARVLDDRDISDRLRLALRTTLDNPQPAFRPNQLVALPDLLTMPWPSKVCRHFKKSTRQSHWMLKPEGFDMRRELRRFARDQNKGRLCYPQSVSEHASWIATIRRQQHLGRTIARHKPRHGVQEILSHLNIRIHPAGKLPESINPALLGFQRLGAANPLPGDLMTYSIAFFTSAAIVTQSTWEATAAEVMVLGGRSTYLTRPENVGAQREYWRFIRERKPDRLVTLGSRLDQLEFKAPTHEDVLKPLASQLQFEEKAFTILASHSGPSLGDDAWQVLYDFANSDSAILTFRLLGKGKQRRLTVEIRYFQAIRSDRLRFLSSAERTLRHLAQAYGMKRLDIYYPLCTRDVMRRALKRRRYSPLRSPHHGKILGKRIILTS